MAQSSPITSPYTKTPPQNIEAEQALIGAILLRPEIIYDLVDIVQASSFYSERHRTIFKTILEFFAKTIPIDLLSLSSRLKEKDELEKIGGSVYLTELVNRVPSTSNAKHYAELIQKKFMMRRLIEAADAIQGLGYDEAEDIAETLDKAEKEIFNVTNTSFTHKFIEMKEILGEAWERLGGPPKVQWGCSGNAPGF